MIEFGYLKRTMSEEIAIADSDSQAGFHFQVADKETTNIHHLIKNMFKKL